MITTLEKEIAFRYLKTRKRDGFLNIISLFSFIGISLGVAVLIIVMSVMNGFRTELINKIVGFNSHITIQPYEKSIGLQKLKKFNLIGIPFQIMIGKKSEGDLYEFKEIGKEAKNLSIKDIAKIIINKKK